MRALLPTKGDLKSTGTDAADRMGAYRDQSQHLFMSGPASPRLVGSERHVAMLSRKGGTLGELAATDWQV